MAVKTNFEANGYKYYKITKTIGKDLSGTAIKKTFYGKSKTEAEAKADTYIELNKKGITQLVNSNVGYMIKDWLWNVRKNSKNFKSSSFDRYERIIRLDIIPSQIAKLQINQITSFAIQKYYNKLYEEGTSSAKIESINKVLSTFLNYCYAQGWIDKNPASKKLIEFPGESDTKLKEDKIKIFCEDEMQNIIKCCSNDSKHIKIHTIILLALTTGMREGEILGLLPQYIDLANKQIHIRKTLEKIALYDEYQNIKGYELKLTDPKTTTSVRTIPLPDFIIPILAEYLEKHCGCVAVFETELNNFIDPRNLARAWERFLKRNNIRYLNFHSLRHTYASLLFSKGATLKEVKELLGHSDIETTEKIYISVTKEDKVKRVDQINSLFKTK